MRGCCNSGSNMVQPFEDTLKKSVVQSIHITDPLPLIQIHITATTATPRKLQSRYSIRTVSSRRFTQRAQLFNAKKGWYHIFISPLFYTITNSEL